MQAWERGGGITSVIDRHPRSGDVAGEALDQSNNPLGPVALSQPLDVAPRYLTEVVANPLQSLG
jgi:hypothetical protein